MSFIVKEKPTRNIDLFGTNKNHEKRTYAFNNKIKKDRFEAVDDASRMLKLIKDKNEDNPNRAAFSDRELLDQTTKFSTEVANAASFGGTPDRGNHLFKLVDDIDPNSPGITGITREGGYEGQTLFPSRVFVEKREDKVAEGLTAVHEMQHADNPSIDEPLLSPEGPLTFPDSREYYGQPAEVNARLAELQAINTMLEVGNVNEASDKGVNLINEVSNYISDYRKRYPQDINIPAYNKFQYTHSPYAKVNRANRDLKEQK